MPVPEVPVSGSAVVRDYGRGLTGKVLLTTVRPWQDTVAVDTVGLLYLGSGGWTKRDRPWREGEGRVMGGKGGGENWEGNDWIISVIGDLNTTLHGKFTLTCFEQNNTSTSMKVPSRPSRHCRPMFLNLGLR